MKTDWKVGDRAYVWYPRKKCNAQELKGSIVLVELMEQVARTWRVHILRSGFTTMWAKRGRVIYVTPDELYADSMELHKRLCTRYSQYLLDQVCYINNHWNDQYDPSRAS
jgi:hypothetical protein